MANDKRRIGEVLVDRGVAPGFVERALVAQAREPGVRLGELVIRQGAAPEDVAQALAEQLGLEYVDPLGVTVDLRVVARLPRELGRQLRAVPIDAPNARTVRVAMADPRDLDAIKTLEFRLAASVRPMVAVPHRIDEALARYHGVEAVAGRVLGRVAPEFRTAQLGPDRLELDPEALGTLLQEGGTRPYVDLVNYVLFTAIERGASDIHVEPQAEGTRVRFRVDGMLRHVVTLPPWAHAPVSTRIKVIGAMDPSEHRRPQDGKADILASGRTITLRVSTVPAKHGENIVIRLLDPSVLQTDLSNLGWPPELVSRYYRLISSPAGLVIVAGPTGSGKSTTLYATIRRLNTETASIVTIEDPIEYSVSGITQVQVNTKAGVTFANSIRSMLRQDPNVLVIGEIRDQETADAAVDAANTGHLVLSTLHTSNSVAAITRLFDLGVPPYLLGAALSGVVTQRLLRRVCTECSAVEEPGPEEWQRLGVEPVLLGRKARSVGPGCERCDETGYRGRVGVYEVLPVEETLARLIQDRATEGAMWENVYAQGLRTLLLDALEKVRDGVTTLEEVTRVVPLSEYPSSVIEQTMAFLRGAGAAPQAAPAAAPRSEESLPEPAPTEPAPTEPAPTEPASTEPASTEPALPEPVAPPALPVAVARARPLVLVVDDAEEVLGLVSLTLEDDYDICVARDGIEALAVVEARQPDLLVLDVMMPRLTGYEVTERLRANPATARLPVLMLSARGQTDHVKRGLHVGADDYLPKPFDPEELLLRVRALLRRAGVLPR